LFVERRMFFQSHWGLMSRGPAVQRINGDIKVRASGLPSSSDFPYWGYDPVGSIQQTYSSRNLAFKILSVCDR